MSGRTKTYRTEAELARRGRRVIRDALTSVGAAGVRTRSEVQAPGGVPDLVIYRRQSNEVHYVVTVEFKLRNWRRALAQAFRHRNFGNEAYVVLDRAGLAPALSQITMFHAANVGLLTLDQNGEVHVWHYPVPKLPFSAKFSRVVARSLLAPSRTLPADLPFIRSTRGGIVLSGLRNRLGSPMALTGSCR
jgi:hypothetical protein